MLLAVWLTVCLAGFVATGTAGAASLPQRIESNGGHYRIVILEGGELRRGAFNRLVFELECDGGCDGVEVKVHGAMPEHEHGMAYVPTVETCGEVQRWCVEGLRFHMPGTWEIYFDIGSRNGTLVERAQATVVL
jgi:hypothetical protein